jgi:hypothetical protein
VSFVVITLCIVSQRVFVVVVVVVVVDFVIDSVRKLLDTPSYTLPKTKATLCLFVFLSSHLYGLLYA